MFVPEELEELAELFHKKKKPLYIVGGYVRSQILGTGVEDDIDLCSAMLPKDVLKLLLGTPFVARIMNERTGVVEIEINGLRFEHATFRTEKYAILGEHMPCEVEFIDSLEKDAERRDFTCNAIYYDIYSSEIIDPLGGVDDIKNKVLRGAISPKFLFVNDSERILRMVRHACCCGFEIDNETYSAAIDNVSKLKYLTSARVRKEIDRILIADLKYPSLHLFGEHIRAVNMLYEIGALAILFPRLDAALSANCTMHGGSVAQDYLSFLLLQATPNVRMPALLAICGSDGYAKDGITQKGYAKESAFEAEEQLKVLGYSPKTIRMVSTCVGLFECFSYDKLALSEARQVVLQNEDYFDELVDFALAARSAYVNHKVEGSHSIQNLVLARKQKNSKIFASNRNQIDISNEDIAVIGKLSPEQIAKIKDELLLLGAKKGDILSRKENVAAAKKIAKSMLK